MVTEVTRGVASPMQVSQEVVAQSWYRRLNELPADKVNVPQRSAALEGVHEPIVPASAWKSGCACPVKVQPAGVPPEQYVPLFDWLTDAPGGQQNATPFTEPEAPPLLQAESPAGHAE
jgi:hypothetical protein